MEHVRRLLGFFLLATTVWLLWIVGQSFGVDGMAKLLGFLLCCGLLAWVYGVVQHESWRRRLIAGVPAVALLVAVSAYALRFDEAAPSSEVASVESGGIEWLAFDEEAIQERLAAGQPVFVDFTADWCITCKFNERTVIHTERVLQAVSRYDIAMFKADWTRRDEGIRTVLARYGRAGVPMYLMYAPVRPEAPELLPELLTQERLIEAFERAGSSPP